MAKYELRGLDCAECANDLECALRREPGLEDARLSFATASLWIDGAQEERARRIIAEREPSLVVVPAGSPAAAVSGAEAPTRIGAWKLAKIVVAALLLAVGSSFHGALHATPFASAEWAVLLSAYALVGLPVVLSALKAALRGRLFNEMFLMTVATVGAMAIHQVPEAVAVMLFYAVGERLQEGAVEKSRRSIASLMALKPESVRLLAEEGRRQVEPERVRPGDVIEVLPGERVPLDGQVLEGSSFVDTSSLTGESTPRSVGPGDMVLGGFVNDGGRLVVRVTAEFGKTAAARILELVEDAAARKAPTERFISRFAAVYTPIVVGIAAAVALLPPLLIPGASFQDWLYRALVILVISCPCALVVSIPLGFFGGIGAAARHKILVKGANHLDALATLDTLVLDKTGTVTKGFFRVQGVVPRNGFSPEEILSLAAAAESHSSHPIARSIREAADASGPGAIASRADDAMESKGMGVSAIVGARTVIVGNDRLLHLRGIEHEDCGAEGTVAFVAVDGRYAGYLSLGDEVKPGAERVVSDLKALGVRRIAMLTGDDRAVAERVARSFGVEEVHAELLPDAKVEALESIAADPLRCGALAFAGDGMNDAPVLMRADIGMAMGGIGSEAAIEAADLVIMDDDISRIPQALRIARFTRKVVWQNIIVAFGVKAAFVALGAMGVAGMWEAVIADVGVALLAVLNALRTIRLSLPGEKGDHPA